MLGALINVPCTPGTEHTIPIFFDFHPTSVSAVFMRCTSAFFGVICLTTHRGAPPRVVR
jgi:hypothetical protein